MAEDRPIAIHNRSLYDESTHMKALEWHASKDVRVVDRPKPRVTDPGDVILKITTTTICGSDLHLYLNLVPQMHKGDILGHEFMGIVESVGPAVKNLKVGDRVVCSAAIACGYCWYCKNQEFSACDNTNPSGMMESMYGHRVAGLFGYSHLTGGYDGGQAEFARVPFADINCLKVPENLNDEQVLFLSDVACTGWHANELGDVSKGDVVCIWGAGPVGLMAAKWAFVRGASRVLIIDNDDHRLEVARNKVGCETINFSRDNVIETVRRFVPDRGPDVCIEAAGFRFPKSFSQKLQSSLYMETDSTDIIDEMVKCVRKCGKLSIIGDYFAYGNHFPIGHFMEKGLQMRGGQVFVQKYWRHLLELIATGKVDTTFIISHTMTLEEAAKAYKMFCNKEDNAIKIILKTAFGRTQYSKQPELEELSSQLASKTQLPQEGFSQQPSLKEQTNLSSSGQQPPLSSFGTTKDQSSLFQQPLSSLGTTKDWSSSQLSSPATIGLSKPVSASAIVDVASGNIQPGAESSLPQMSQSTSSSM